MKTAKDYLQQPYARIVIPELGGFHAEILEFPGCFAQGNTLQKAYANLEKAAEAWIDTCLSQGHSIPEPASSVGFSGRIVVRMPKSIHKQAAVLAEQDETSLNTYIVSALSSKVGVEDFYSVLAERFERHIYNFMGAMFNHFSVTNTNTVSKKLPAVEPEQVISTANAGVRRMAQVAGK
jgi:predicted RNase H-like HicB family nuclease